MLIHEYIPRVWVDVLRAIHTERINTQNITLAVLAEQEIPHLLKVPYFHTASAHERTIRDVLPLRYIPLRLFLLPDRGSKLVQRSSEPADEAHTGATGRRVHNSSAEATRCSYACA